MLVTRSSAPSVFVKTLYTGEGAGDGGGEEGRGIGGRRREGGGGRGGGEHHTTRHTVSSALCVCGNAVYRRGMGAKLNTDSRRVERVQGGWVLTGADAETQRSLK